MSDALPDLVVRDRAAWRRWLWAHHADPGVWLALAKKGTTSPTTLTYHDALLEALCHGWIDGQMRRGDDRVYYQRFTQRRPKSRWSLRNTQLIDELTAQGRMHPAGLAAVAAAKATGQWDAAYAGQHDSTVPEDLRAALDRSPRARAAFERLTAQNRYAMLHRLGSVAGATARRRRIDEYITMLEQGRTLHPQRAPLH
jgi:uncharacterized protein YdeI (YjbR/CyaY-like superfamily)